jgi:hypothetical protein
MGAKKAGYTPIIEMRGVTIRFVPIQQAASFRELEYTPALLSDSRPTSAQSSEVQKYYDDLGFDPKTMNESDLRRLVSEAEARWRASIPGSPLTKREVKVLAQFRAYGPGVPVDPDKIKGSGIETAERLGIRGFIEFRYRSKFPDRIESLVLTVAGDRALRSLALQE